MRRGFKIDSSGGQLGMKPVLSNEGHYLIFQEELLHGSR